MTLCTNSRWFWKFQAGFEILDIYVIIGIQFWKGIPSSHNQPGLPRPHLRVRYDVTGAYTREDFLAASREWEWSAQTLQHCYFYGLFDTDLETHLICLFRTVYFLSLDNLAQLWGNICSATVEQSGVWDPLIANWRYKVTKSTENCHWQAMNNVVFQICPKQHC